MRLIIVDDEHLARAVLREYLASEPDIEIVAECANGFEAVKAIAELAPQLVLLDIQMPKLNGFEVVELAGSGGGGKHGPQYIFVTAFDQYALKAFEVRAIDYLLKPFTRERLQQALTHARARLPAPTSASPAAANPMANSAANPVLSDTPADALAKAGADVAGLLQDIAKNQPLLERILIRDGGRVHVIPVAKIDFIEAQDDYVQIRAEGKSWLKNARLSELENRLSAQQFVRIHRSYLVNIEALGRIEQSSKDSHVAILRDGSKLPISRSGYQKVKSLIA
jgi:two-component system LytT family response regulator